MDSYKRIYIKLYYKFLNGVINTKKRVAPELSNKKNIFLYFDYEREFSGLKTYIKDDQIYEILDLLDKYQFKTTWFTVGKIIDKYSNSIDEILRRGHEIGSHTYNHIPPLLSSFNDLSKDFCDFEVATNNRINLQGFHSPNGLWTHKNFKLFKKYGYLYDVIGAKEDFNIEKVKLPFLRNMKTFRLKTIGDDWNLYKNQPNPGFEKDYFINMLKPVSFGDVVGIGFHPWVLHKDKSILLEFENLLRFLSQSNNKFSVLRACDYIHAVKKR